jgi:hypothetical protein
MMRYIGFTKNARFIFQDFSTGDVLIKQNEADEVGISYPYEQWVGLKENIADLETIKKEFNPLRPEPTPEELENSMKQRAEAMKQAAVIVAKALARMIINNKR